MTEEPTIREIRTDDDEPATKGLVRDEIDKLAQATQHGFDELRGDMATMKDELRSEMHEIKAELRSEMINIRDELRSEMSAMKSELRAEMADMKDEIRSEMSEVKDEIINEFKVVAENIHQDVAGANRDEITFIKDQQLPDHEARLRTLEEQAEIAVGPRV
ncbi:MAG: DUF1640 domain-containing protein [Planctomycetales bacterium]|nr:DUF1640 domain-containing protein [Planctomycetales bacterium]